MTERIDARDLRVWPLAERKNKLAIEQIAIDPESDAPELPVRLARQVEDLADRIVAARRSGAARMLAYGAHLVKNGGGTLLIWLVRNGYVTHVATQGAGIIHDWEFAYCGQSSESVEDNTAAGRFGSWDETGRAVNLSALVGTTHGLGLGAGIGQLVVDDGLDLPDPEALVAQIAAHPGDDLTAARAELLRVMRTHGLAGGRWDIVHPFKRFCVSYHCRDAGVPLTVHPGIGYDIYTNHPLFSGGAIGRGSELDVRAYAASMGKMIGGVYLSVGSAIMSPQIFEKAFSLANNLRISAGGAAIHDHNIAIIDIQDGGNWDWTTGEPPMDHPAYYLRFCKTFYRMGGRVDYLQGDNTAVLHNLIAALRARED